MILPLRRQFEEKAVVRITRRLPGPGKIVVRPGDRVAQTDAIGTAEVSGGTKRLNLAQALGVTSAQADSLVLKKPGEAIYRGEPLARRRVALGLRNKVYLSPSDGVIDSVSGGEVTIRFAPSEVSVPAGFSGLVEEVAEGEEVKLRLTANVWRGLAGTGGQNFGEIKLVGTPNEPITPQDLDGSCRGRILIGGALLPAETIEKAVTIGVTGFLSGGVNFHDSLSWQSERRSPLTIVSLSGYGEHPIGEDLWKKLSGLDGKLASLSGEDLILIVPTDGTGKDKVEPTWRELHSGDIVRVTVGDDLGTVGVALGSTTEAVKLPSGLTSEVVKIRSHGKDLALPWQNLEIIDTK